MRQYISKNVIYMYKATYVVKFKIIKCNVGVFIKHCLMLLEDLEG